MQGEYASQHDARTPRPHARTNPIAVLRWFRKLGATDPVGRPKRTDDPDAIVPVPIPTLVVLLQNAEDQKGAPLTEAVVLEIRDRAVCMMMPASVRDATAEQRGYADIDLADAWAEWQRWRA